jgi:hypothetical protein
MAEAIRLRKLKVDGWKVAAIEKDKERYGMLLDLHIANAAARDALLKLAIVSGDIAGDRGVTIVHGRTNSVLYNVLTGSVKSSTLAVPGWRTADFIKGVISEPIGDLSLEAARLYADTFNSSLSKCDGTTAIVTQLVP